MMTILVLQAAACRQPLTPETTAAGVRKFVHRWKGQIAQNSLQVQKPAWSTLSLEQTQITLWVWDI